MKKRIYALILFSAILLLSLCCSSKNVYAETGFNTKYNRLIDKYQAAFGTNTFDYCIFSTYMVASGFSTLEYSDMGYKLYDVNKDGVPELFFTAAMDGSGQCSDGSIYDLYTYYNGKIVHLAQSSERAYYYYGSDKSVYLKYKDGALDHYWVKYKIVKNKLKIVHVVYEKMRDSVVYYFYKPTGDEFLVYNSTGGRLNNGQ